MNRIAKLSVIAALSALTFGGVSHAAGTEMNWPTQIDRTVRDLRVTTSPSSTSIR
ncbi:hypothetical protein [Ensifer sp. 4252]|uniref:hypothetical protein n=1 Tax=Ensifer sp. 4252 TaxID=3373915 RepID=UPI003D19F4B6